MIMGTPNAKTLVEVQFAICPIRLLKTCFPITLNLLHHLPSFHVRCGWFLISRRPRKILLKSTIAGGVQVAHVNNLHFCMAEAKFNQVEHHFTLLFHNIYHSKYTLKARKCWGENLDF